MSLGRIPLLVLVLALVSPTLRAAEMDPASVITGNVRLSLSNGYASLKVDGEEWEETFFENDGKLLVIEGLERDKEHALTLQPMEEELKAEELVLLPSQWKLERVDRDTREWQLRKTITFRRWKAGEREELERKAAAKARAEESGQTAAPVQEPVPAPAPEVVPAPVPKVVPAPAAPAAPAPEPAPAAPIPEVVPAPVAPALAAPVVEPAPATPAPEAAPAPQAPATPEAPAAAAPVPPAEPPVPPATEAPAAPVN